MRCGCVMQLRRCLAKRRRACWSRKRATRCPCSARRPPRPRRRSRGTRTGANWLPAITWRSSGDECACSDSARPTAVSTRARSATQSVPSLITSNSSFRVSRMTIYLAVREFRVVRGPVFIYPTHHQITDQTHCQMNLWTHDPTHGQLSIVLGGNEKPNFFIIFPLLPYPLSYSPLPCWKKSVLEVFGKFVVFMTSLRNSLCNKYTFRTVTRNVMHDVFFSFQTTGSIFNTNLL